MCHSTTCLLHKKGDPTFLDNYRPIALMKNLLKLWTALIRVVGSKYAETHGSLSDMKDGFRHQRSIHDALSSIIMMMEDAKPYNKDIYGMYDMKDGFRHQHIIHDALSSIIMMMEDAKPYNKDIYGMYADFKGAFNAADHRIMFKHMRQLDMPSIFVDTCEQFYGVSTTDYITPYGSTPSIDIKRGTMQGDILSPFMFTLFLEPFLR
jgi:hypothetical protein